MNEQGKKESGSSKTKLDKRTYEKTLGGLQAELVELQHWDKKTGLKSSLSSKDAMQRAKAA